MSLGVVLDLLLVVILGWYALTGFRQGFVTSVLSLLGFLGGGALGMAVLPRFMESSTWATEHTTTARALLVAAVLVLATAGQTLGGLGGRTLRRQVRTRRVATADSVLGSVAGLVVVAVLMWFVASGLRGVSSATIGKAIGESHVLSAIDRVVPAQTGRLFADFRRALANTGFPRVFEGLSTEPITPVEPPSRDVGGPRIEAALESVVKVRGIAEECRQEQEGSGWVVSARRVVTNAHVVSGATGVTVQVKGEGAALPATVVYFDPQRDLAVLAVPELSAPPLAQGEVVGRGSDVVVAGFPLDGALQVDPARVRQQLVATGDNIYGEPGTRREIYSLYAEVEPGNSGGPLLDAAGRVVGVIFAKSIDDPLTGYALTLAETRPVLDAAAGANTSVDTGVCLVGGG